MFPTGMGCALTGVVTRISNKEADPVLISLDSQIFGGSS